jgi:hypothetical protein
MRKWPWVRIALGVVAAVILFFAIPLFFTSAKIYRCTNEALTAELMRRKVDLSHPGEFAWKFNNTLEDPPLLPYGLRFQVVTEPPITLEKEAQSILMGLSGHLTIVGPDGTVVFKKLLQAEDFDFRRIDNPQGQWGITTDLEYCPLRGRWITEGTSVLKLSVDRGAVRLTDIPHSLVVQYQLDGLENLGALMAWLYGAASSAIAGLLVLVIILATIPKTPSSCQETNSGQGLS